MSNQPLPVSSDAYDHEPMIDLRSVGQLVQYVLGSFRRRKKLMFMAFGVAFLVCLFLSFLIPRTYDVHVRVLTNRSYLLAALVHPERAVPVQADDPTHGVIEIIQSRENLLGLIRDVQLEKRWLAERGVLNQFKDYVLSFVVSMSALDRQDALVRMLNNRITADIEGDVISFHVRWTEAETAYKIAEAILKRFKEQRLQLEQGELLDTVRILEKSLVEAEQNLNATSEEVLKLFKSKEALLAPSGSHASLQRAFSQSLRSLSSIQGVRREQELARKEEALLQLKRNLQQRIIDAEKELAQLLKTLGPNHPDVAEARRTADALRSQLHAMPEIQKLEGDVALLKQSVGRSTAVSAPAAAFDVSSLPEVMVSKLDQDPEMQQAFSNLRSKQETYQEVNDRLHGARIEVETSNAAFAYRYLTMEPPLFPRKPVSPKMFVLLFASIFFAAFSAMGLALVTDIVSGRLLESWQIERFSHIRVLGEVRTP